MNHIVAIQKSITAQANRATRLPSPVAQFRTFLRLNDKVAGKPAEVPPPPPPAEGDKPNGETPPPPPPAEGEGEAQGASEVADEGQGSATDEGAEGKQDAPAKKRRGRK